MAVNNNPKDDSKAMTDEYIKGYSIDEIAEKYNHSTIEVEAIVVKPAVDELPTQVTQAFKEKQDQKEKA
jgi:L-lactate utilization protein LutC